MCYSVCVDAEDSKKLDRILALAEENNEYIRKVRTTQKNAQMFKAIYWVVIISVALGGIYVVKPYLNSLMGLYSGLGAAQGVSSNTNFKIPDADQLQNLVNQLKN